MFWPSNELLFLAQEHGWLNPSEFRLVEFVDDGEVMRAFRNHAVAAAWLSMDEVLAVAQSGAVDPVILFLSDESRGGDAVVAQPDFDHRGRLEGSSRRGADQLGQRLPARSRAQAGGARRQRRAPRQPATESSSRTRSADARWMRSSPTSLFARRFSRRAVSRSSAAPRRRSRCFACSSSRRDYLESHQPQADALCTAWQRAINEMVSSEQARDWIANRLGTTLAGLDRMIERIRVISLAREPRVARGAAAAVAGDGRAAPG